MVSGNFVIRPMSRVEIDMAIEWAALEGWNPGLYDGDGFHEADTGGFLVGELDREPIATISAVRYGNAFGFMGFYIVRPEFRGQGYGVRIWNAAMERLTGRNIGLDGVVAQQENYRKSGFALAYRNVRYEGKTGGITTGRSDIVDLAQLPFDQIQAYDQQFFPDNRSAFLKAWIRQPDRIALGILRDGSLCGYGMLRECRTGYKIGPLFAENPTLAEDLFQELIGRAKPGQPVYLDAPEVNNEAVALAERHDMTVVFETARMYTGRCPDLPMDRLFGVTSFELG